MVQKSPRSPANILPSLSAFAKKREQPGHGRQSLDSGVSCLYCQSRPLAPNVYQLTAVSDANLQALYSLATALLYPSWQEGFGWPIIEAQSCGCPVFTSNRAPMTEVASTAAVYFNPHDPVQAAAIIWRQFRSS